MTKSKDRTPIQGMFLTPISIFILIDILLNIIYSNIIIIECFFLIFHVDFQKFTSII